MSTTAFETAFDRLDDATASFDREVGFAIDTREAFVLAQAVDPDALNRAAQAIEGAAQAIACHRGTCCHEHPSAA